MKIEDKNINVAPEILVAEGELPDGIEEQEEILALEEANSTNNKRIAKNTMLLYFRMLLTMGVSLYTSRVVLEVLGVEDFGVYNVVGSVVVMFSYLNSAMTASTQRFLNFAMGEGDSIKLKNIFSMSVNIHILFALLILVFSETIGLWLLCNKVSIPESSRETITYVYQFSIATALINVLSMPYNAVIIANERMKAFAYISLVEVLLKLGIAFSLFMIDDNRLVFYSAMMFFLSFAMRIIYTLYCKSNFEESHFHLLWNKNLFKEMFSFAGWNFFGATAGVVSNQGVNLLLNIFFGPVVNAARAIAVQIQGAVLSFVTNFMTAVNPQIVKSYASGNIDYTINLMTISSKYSFILLYIITYPIYYATDLILSLWLVEVPKNAIEFTRLILIYSYTLALTYSINMASQATGNIKTFQICEGFILLLTFPVSYFFLKLGYSQNTVFYVLILFSIIAFVCKLVVLNRCLSFSLNGFLMKVLFRSILVFGLNLFLLNYVVGGVVVVSLINKLLLFAISFFVMLISIYFILIDKSERSFISNKLKNRNSL